MMIHWDTLSKPTLKNRHMTSLRAKALLLVFSAVVTAGLACAQEQTGDTGGAADAEKQTVRGKAFTALALSKLPYKNLYYRSGKKIIKMEMRNGKRSMPYSLPSAKLLEIFTDHKDPEKKYRLIGKAPLVSDSQKMLYFFRARPKAGGRLPIAIFAIDDSETAFPESSYRFINFMRVPIVIDFNKKRFLVKPVKPTVKKLNLTKSGEWTPFVVRDTKGKVLGGTRLFNHATNRKLVLIFPPKKGEKRLDIRFFSD